MSDLDDLFTITCGACHITSQFTRWVVALPPDHFVCPVCGFGFKRKSAKKWNPYGKLVELVAYKAKK